MTYKAILLYKIQKRIQLRPGDNRLIFLLILLLLLSSASAEATDRRDLKYAAQRLQREIDIGDRHGVDTKAYKSALQNMEPVINRGKPKDETLKKLDDLSNELTKKLDASEKAPETNRAHVGLIVGFSGDAPKGGLMSSYSSQRASAESPVYVKGLDQSGSAVKSGIAVGDRLVSVNGSDVNGLSLYDIMEKLRGEPNSTVSIGYFSKTGGNKTAKLSRTTKTILEPL